jgi:hypothetical protein
MPHEPITTTTIPAPPRGFAVFLQLGLGLVAFGVLFMLPPCASSSELDMAVLTGLGLWAGLTLIRCLGWSRHRRGSPILPPRVAAVPARVADDRNEHA